MSDSAVALPPASTSPLTAGLIDEIHLGWALRRLHFQWGMVLEMRPIFEADDFGKQLTPELRAQEQRLRAEIERQRKS
jgi:hypothetical protein